MKILVVGPQYTDSFANNIAVTLQAMGHTVVCADEGISRRLGESRYVTAFWSILHGAFPALGRLYFNSLIRQAAKLQPDLVLVVHSQAPPEVIERVKESCAAKVVCWFTDSILGLYRQYLLGAPYDAVFLKEPFLVRAFREKLGINAHYLPECCNPLWHKRVTLTKQEESLYGCDLAAIGTLHYYRAGMLKDFASRDLKIWGVTAPSWVGSPLHRNYTNHYVVAKDKAKALVAAKVVINPILFAEIEGVNCTLFEAAGCGAFQIADWKPALAELFEPEREIVTFRTRQELKEKVEYYLAHPEERAEISMRSYERAHREHTYQVRLNKMLGVLGFASEPLSTLELAEFPRRK